MLSENKETDTKKDVISFGLKFFLKYGILSIIIAAIIHFICIYFNSDISYIPHDISTTNRKAHYFSYLFAVGIFSPIIEETTFRLWLSFKRKHIAITVFLLTYMLIYLITINGKIQGSISMSNLYFTNIIEHHSIGFWYRFPISVASALLVYFIPVDKKTLTILKSKRFHTSCIWVSLLVFTFGHIFNYQFQWYELPVIIVMCALPFIVGTVLTHFRLKLGFFYGFLFHSIYNCFIFII